MNTIPLPFPLKFLQPLDFPRKLGICDRLFGHQLAENGICWVQTSTGIPWKLDLTNPIHRWIVYGKYEGAAFLKWLRHFVPSDGIVIDSGANIGQMLLYIAQWLPQGQVFAYEPGTAQADWLAECLAANPHLPVKLIRKGLGATQTQLKLATPGPQSAHGLWSHISETEGEPIEIVRLSDELGNFSVSQVDVWKVDLEGYEIPAFQGAKELLENQKIRALYVEMGSKNYQETVDFLKQLNYTCYLFDARGQLFNLEQSPHYSFPIWTNGLFLSEAEVKKLN
ncbi:MAG: FkbM family methyltransferase [Desertifilum sp.]|nr:FkbM family methyltransferase [Desertifilum sp.]